MDGKEMFNAEAAGRSAGAIAGWGATRTGGSRVGSDPGPDPNPFDELPAHRPLAYGRDRGPAVPGLPVALRKWLAHDLLEGERSQGEQRAAVPPARPAAGAGRPAEPARGGGDDPAFRDVLSRAKLILGRHPAGGEPFLVYGREVLKGVLPDDGSPTVTTMMVHIDPASDQMAELLATVTAVKGRHDYKA